MTMAAKGMADHALLRTQGGALRRRARRRTLLKALGMSPHLGRGGNVGTSYPRHSNGLAGDGGTNEPRGADRQRPVQTPSLPRRHVNLAA
jgi:hypothetical protein